MATDTKKATSLLLTIPLLILTLGLFLAMLGTGAWGIVEAINQDPCVNRNLTGLLGCEVQISLTSQSGDQLTDQPFAWYNWMVVSTVVGLLWAVVTTLAGQALLWTVEEFNKDNKKTGGHDLEMQELHGSRTDGSVEDVDSGVVAQKTITLNSPGLAGQSKQNLVPSPLRKLTLGGTFGLFFCLFFLVLGIMSLLWGIATAYGNTRTDNVVLATYVTVEILTAILLPIFFFISGILLAGILDFITWGRLDLRTLVPKFLPVVKFESGVETGVDPDDSKPFDYWVIEDTFYFEVKKRVHLKKKEEKPSFGDSFDRSKATWALTFIVCLGIHLPVAYFVDYTLDTQDTLLAPDGCDTIDSTYRCFEAISLEPAGCMDTNGTVHCFKFLRFGVDVDIISAASTAFAFFLIASTAFTSLFTIMKILLHLKPTCWWGLTYIIVGGLGFLGAIGLVIWWATGYVAPLINEIIHFNIINVAQFFMVCEYLFIVGLLLVAAKWWENVPVADHKPKQRRELVEYVTANRGEVDKAASDHAKETIAKDKAAEAIAKDKAAEATGDKHGKEGAGDKSLTHNA